MKFAMWRIIAAIFLCSASTYAHEIGTTRVSVVFQQGASYEIEVVTDAASLAEKLQALSGQPPQLGAVTDRPYSWWSRTVGALYERPNQFQVQLQNYDELFRRRLIIAFDGTAVSPEIDYSVSGTATETSSPVATIRMRGAIPHGARQFAWTYSWTFATYSLSVREAAGD